MNVRFFTLVSVVGAALVSLFVPAAPRLRSRSQASVARRVLVVTDMEGLSGVNDGRMVSTAQRNAEYYAAGLDRLHADVNATIAGLFEGGAAAVDVADAHAEGRNLTPSRLDPRARLIPHDSVGDPYFDLAKRGRYDAVVCVGMHDKPLSGGFSAHTLGAGLSPVINNATLTETELIAYEFGMVNVPVIFVSGDDHLQRDLERTMPWVVYVSVKRATSLSTADLVPARDVEAALRGGARRAVESLSRMKMLEPTTPIRAGLLATYPMSLPPAGSRFSRLPGIEYRGDTITFPARDYPEAYDRVRFLVGFAVLRKDQAVLRIVGSRPDGMKPIEAANDSIFSLWDAFEAGTWRPGMPAPAARR